MLGPSESAATWQKRDKICNAGPPLEQSAKWAKHIILERLPSLPSDPTELEAILFPATSEERLPISPSLYQEYHSASPEAATAFLTPADASKLPRHVSFQRGWRHRSPTDMATFSYVDSSMRQLLHSFRLYSCHPLDHKICQNSSEGVTPDTYMYIAVAGCTMVVGEGIAASQNEAAAHMKRKQLQQSLLPLLYGPLKFIVGHKAAGATFQWYFVGADGRTLVKVGPVVDFTIPVDKCHFVLSLANLYCLMVTMSRAVPNLHNRLPMAL